MIKDNLVFLREFVKEFQTTGSVFPTSRWAAKALTSPMMRIRSPQHILEHGPGTGSVTVKILKRMNDGDKLTICEINPRFMASLQKKLAKNEDYLRHRDRIDFFLGPMQELPEVAKYDVIVCAIPFLNFDRDTVREMFTKLKKLVKDNTIMTYYEYIGLRAIGKSVAPPITKRRMRELDSFFGEISKSHGMRRERVWLNVLPINIYTLKFAA